VLVCGVLALQGGWDAHRKILCELGAEGRPVRTAADLEAVDCLVIPGGESTAMLHLMEGERLSSRLAERLHTGMAALATCAGVILLAQGVDPEQESLGIMALGVERNAYGRQVHSTIAPVTLAAELGDPPQMEGVFIRAPRITRLGPEVEILGRLGEDPVLVRQDRVLGATFHPELAADRRVHLLFLEMAEVGHG